MQKILSAPASNEDFVWVDAGTSPPPCILQVNNKFAVTFVPGAPYFYGGVSLEKYQVYGYHYNFITYMILTRLMQMYKAVPPAFIYGNGTHNFTDTVGVKVLALWVKLATDGSACELC